MSWPGFFQGHYLAPRAPRKMAGFQAHLTPAGGVAFWGADMGHFPGVSWFILSHTRPHVF